MKCKISFPDCKILEEKKIKTTYQCGGHTRRALFTISNGRDVIMAKLQPYHKLDKLVGNQFAIRVRKRCSDYDCYQFPHKIFNEECLEYVSTHLSHRGLKMWCWFNLHRDKEEFALSRQQVCNDLQFSVTIYKQGLKELREKEFLVPAQLHPGIKGWLFIDEGPLRNLRGVSYEGELNPQGFTIV